MINIPASYAELAEHKNLWISRKQVMGCLAHWAVRQSPYDCPDNLHIVLMKLSNLWKYAKGGLDIDFAQVESMQFLEDWLKGMLRRMPEYLAWNERKNGNPAPYGFTSRFDSRGEPDDDFIDLDALERNIAIAVWREAVHARLWDQDFDRRYRAARAGAKEGV